MKHDEALQLLDDLSLKEWAGRLGSDPVLNRMPGNKVVLNMRIALEPLVKVKHRLPDRPRENTQWLHCSNWSHPHEIIAMGLKKNDLVVVKGQPVLREYRKNGDTILELDAIIVMAQRIYSQ